MLRVETKGAIVVWVARHEAAGVGEMLSLGKRAGRVGGIWVFEWVKSEGIGGFFGFYYRVAG